MSITIKGASSGGVDIVAPASGSNVTLTLPTTTATVETTTSSITSSRLTGALPAISGASLTNLPAGGVNGIVSTANATAITIDSSENVGIGVTPKSTWDSAYSVLQLGGSAALWGHSSTAGYLSQNVYNDGGYKYLNTSAASLILMNGGEFWFRVAPSGTADASISWNTAMTLDNSGRLYFGAAGVQQSAQISIAHDGHSNAVSGTGRGINLESGQSTTSDAIRFANTNGQVGRIITNGSATAYQTSSDYRLKENLVPITDSIERVKALNVYRFNFLADPTVTVDGFVAHEVFESGACPEAISGEKDAMTTEEYEITPAVMGDSGVEIEPAVMGEREIMDPQGIDQSKLVPLLTAALQDAIKRIEILENA